MRVLGIKIIFLVLTFCFVNKAIGQKSISFGVVNGKSTKPWSNYLMYSHKNSSGFEWSFGLKYFNSNKEESTYYSDTSRFVVIPEANIQRSSTVFSKRFGLVSGLRYNFKPSKRFQAYLGLNILYSKYDLSIISRFRTDQMIGYHYIWIYKEHIIGNEAIIDFAIYNGVKLKIAKRIYFENSFGVGLAAQFYFLDGHGNRANIISERKKYGIYNNNIQRTLFFHERTQILYYNFGVSYTLGKLN